MPKCAECSANCIKEPLVLLQADRNLNFCSLECLIAHSVNRVRRRIAGQNRKMQRFLHNQVDHAGMNSRRATKLRVN
jgi:hypothetical protein